MKKTFAPQPAVEEQDRDTDLPEGWTRATLFELSQPKQWPTISTKSLLSKGYPVYGANGQIGFYSEYNHKNPTILITCRGATCGTLNISKPCAYVTGNAMALDDLNEHFCNLHFLYYALRNRGLEDTISGSAQPQITRQNLQFVNLGLAPYTEQTHIVAKIEDLLAYVDTSRARLAKIPKLLKAFRQSVLAAACSGRLTDDWREMKHKDMDGWEQASLGDVADSRLGKMLDQAKNVGSPTSYLRNTNVRWFSFDLNDLFLMRASQQDQREFNIENGDLLVCEGGEPGRCAVWNLGPTNLIFQKAIHRIRLKSNISPLWLAFNLKHDADSGKLGEYFTGSGIKHLTGRSLATYTFQVPPLEEQHQIVRRVEALFKLADTIEQRVEAASKR